MPVNNYMSIKNLILKNKLDKETEELLFQEILTQSGDTVDLSKLIEIIGLYNFYPMRVKKNRNKSDDLY
jgi:hypothetical protein